MRIPNLNSMVEFEFETEYKFEFETENKIFCEYQPWYLGIESILLKHSDKILQLPLRLPKHIMEGRVKILETYEKIISFYPHIFVCLQTFIMIR